MPAILKSDNHPANHKGSIVRWKRFNYKEEGGYTIEEDILLEPMDYQIMVTYSRGVIVLSSDEAQTVELINANLWDDSCEKRLEEIGKELSKYK